MRKALVLAAVVAACVAASASAINVPMPDAAAVQKAAWGKGYAGIEWTLRTSVDAPGEADGVCDGHGGVFAVGTEDGGTTPEGVPITIHVIICKDGTEVKVEEEGWVPGGWWTPKATPVFANYDGRDQHSDLDSPLARGECDLYWQGILDSRYQPGGC